MQDCKRRLNLKSTSRERRPIPPVKDHAIGTKEFIFPIKDVEGIVSISRSPSGPKLTVQATLEATKVDVATQRAQAVAPPAVATTQAEKAEPKIRV
jgi:hypothetical protein